MTWSRRLSLTGILTLLLFSLGAAAAIADGGGAFAPILGALDGEDSHGIKVSQYQSTAYTSLIRAPLSYQWASYVNLGWEAYRWTVGFVAFIIDFVVGGEWLIWLITPLDMVSDLLRENIIVPLGMDNIGSGGVISLIFMIAAALAFWKILVAGKRGQGIADLIIGALMASLAVTIFATPVATLFGSDGSMADPLRMMQRAGNDVANMITTGEAMSTAPIDEASTGGPKLGAVYRDTFIRAPHQAMNFGQIVDGTECQDVYDQVLAEGPYPGDAGPIREKLGGCDKKLEEYAANASPMWLVILFIFAQSLVWASVIAIALTVLMFLGLVEGTVAAVKLTVKAVFAILPGTGIGIVVMDIATICYAMIWIASGPIVVALYFKVIRAVLGSASGVELIPRYAVVGLLLFVGIIFVIQAWWATRSGTRSWFGKLADRARATIPKPRKSLGEVASGVHHTQEAVRSTKQTAMSAGKAAARGGRGLTKIASTAGKAGMTVAATAASGGTAAVAKGALLARKTARGVKYAKRGRDAYRAVRSGVDAVAPDTGSQKTNHLVDAALAAPDIAADRRRGKRDSSTGNRALDRLVGAGATIQTRARIAARWLGGDTAPAGAPADPPSAHVAPAVAGRPTPPTPTAHASRPSGRPDGRGGNERSRPRRPADEVAEFQGRRMAEKIERERAAAKEKQAKVNARQAKRDEDAQKKEALDQIKERHRQRQEAIKEGLRRRKQGLHGRRSA